MPKAGKRAAVDQPICGDGGVMLHNPDRDTQDYTQAVHEEALQQHSTFCAIDQCGYDDRTDKCEALSKALSHTTAEMTATAWHRSHYTFHNANVNVAFT